jgi:hypothetical protein
VDLGLRSFQPTRLGFQDDSVRKRETEETTRCKLRKGRHPAINVRLAEAGDGYGVLGKGGKQAAIPPLRAANCAALRSG